VIVGEAIALEFDVAPRTLQPVLYRFRGWNPSSGMSSECETGRIRFTRHAVKPTASAWCPFGAEVPAPPPRRHPVAESSGRWVPDRRDETEWLIR